MAPALTLLRESRQIETRASYFGDMRACLCSLLAVALVGCYASQYHSSQTRSSYGLRAARVDIDDAGRVSTQMSDEILEL